MVRRTCLVLLLFLNIFCLFADSRTEALALERAGKTREAVSLYSRWLQENPRNSGAQAVVIHAAALIEIPLDVIKFMIDHIDFIPEDDRGEVYSRVAGLEMTLGRLDAAVEHWQMAAETDAPNADLWELKSLQLLYSMGEPVRGKALGLRASATTGKLRGEAGLLAALELNRNGDLNGSLRELEDLLDSGLVIPSVLFEYSRLLEASGEHRASQDALERLRTEFPDSTSLYLAQMQILDWITPSTFIEQKQQQRSFAVQVGAFGQREYASALREKLEADGFTAWFEERDGLWKVMVHDADGLVASRLMDKGYETSVGR